MLASWLISHFSQPLSSQLLIFDSSARSAATNCRRCRWQLPALRCRQRRRQQGAAVAATAAAGPQQLDFTQQGPYEVQPACTLDWDLGGDVELQRRLAPSLQLRLTVPAQRAPGGPVPNSHPTLLFFNGFLARSAWYAPLLDQLASWGWAVLQYDSPKLNEVAPAGIENEVLLFEPLLGWLEGAGGSQPRLQGLLDPDRLAVAGHSRGGKLATLAFTDEKVGQRFRAAYLVDPVDLFSPSAVEALERSGRRLGVTGGGVWGPLNPPLVNYAAFYDAAAPGSWLERLPGVTHLEFCDAGAVGNWWLDRLDRFPEWMRTLLLSKGLDGLLSLTQESDLHKLLIQLGGDQAKLRDLQRLTQRLACELRQGGGTADPAAAVERRRVAGATSAAMLAWFHQELEGLEPLVDPQLRPPSLQAFFSWAEAEQQHKRLELSIKGQSPAAAD